MDYKSDAEQKLWELKHRMGTPILCPICGKGSQKRLSPLIKVGDGKYAHSKCWEER